MIAVVLDTNVLAAGFAGLRQPTSTPGALLRAWLLGRYLLVVSGPLLAEVARTLRKPYFTQRRTAAQLAGILTVLQRQPRLVTPAMMPQRVAAHPEDDLILATAVSGRAD